jgi:hypothetical protein
MQQTAPQNPRVRRLAALSASLTLLGCSAIVQPDRVQCSTTLDCTSRGDEFRNSICLNQVCQAPGPWSCLGSVTWPTGTAPEVTVSLNLIDLTNKQPVAAVSARLCNKLDSTCATPLVSGVTSDSAGRVAMRAPQGFDGYVELTGAGIMRGSFFVYPPLTVDRDVAALPVLRMEALSVFAGMAGGALMADRGHIIVRAYNCLGQPADGVKFSSADADAQSAAFYMIKGVPLISHTETDSSGSGGLLNLRAGSVTLTGQTTSGASLGTLAVLTRAGELTYTSMVPTPR